MRQRVKAPNQNSDQPGCSWKEVNSAAISFLKGAEDKVVDFDLDHWAFLTATKSDQALT